jgi:DNA repair exonuclease SbcCD nuclease subunit
MVDDCKEREVDTICIAGDLLHNKSIIHTTAQDAMLDFFRESYDMKFIVIDGNHDLSGKGSDSVSALKSLDEHDYIDWISFQSKMQTHKQIDNVAFMPYFPGMQDHIKNIEADILISHFGLSEAMLSSGISIQSSIKASDLKHFKLVVLGHYHMPQAMLSGPTHIYYTGSPIQLDWGEKNEEKRFLIIDTENPQDVECVDTRGYKKYIEMKIDSDNKSEKIAEAKTLRDDGHHIKLITSEKLELTDDMKNINIVSNVEEDITNRGITSEMEEFDIHTKYLEIKDISEYDREAYINSAKKIMDETILPE